MDLTDYTVSYSLQINTRCLRFLSECHAATAPSAGSLRAMGGSPARECLGENQPLFTESVLVRDSRRLQALWRVVRPALAPARADEVRAHTRRLKQIARQLGNTGREQSLLGRLSGFSETGEATEALQALAAALPEVAPLGWSDLNDVFAHDSAWWRCRGVFVPVGPERLLAVVAHGYRRACRNMRRLPGDWVERTGADALNLLDLERQVRNTCYQLELLRPGLSQKGKAQLWYMEKLTDALRMRNELAALQVSVQGVQQAGHLSSAVATLAEETLGFHVLRMNRRVAKLASGALGLRPKRFRMRLEQACDRLHVNADAA